MNVSASAPKSEHARSTSPTTTARSAIRRVSRKVFAARIASAPKRNSPSASSIQAAGERASGTPGTSRGTSTPTRLTVRTIATTAATRPSRTGIDRRSLTTARRREGEDRRTDRERGGAGQRDDAVLPDEHAGRDEPVHGKERGHDREPSGDDDRAGVTAPRPDRHQHERRGSGGERAHADAVEVHPQRRHHHHAAEQPEHEHREQRHPDEEADPGDRHAQPHPSRYRQDWAELKAVRSESAGSGAKQ